MEQPEKVKEFDQQKHPEILEGEVWITNSDDSDYGAVGWKTKRRGEIAYDVNGEVVKASFPVFIQVSEKDKELKE